jgi:GT2 family glycosyltransferase
MSDRPTVSLVVPTYQRRSSVVRLLEALRKQTLPAAQFEVVVVIDGSNDGTREAVEQFESQFVVRSISQENRGRAATVNSGVAMARGEIVVMLDDDMEPAAELLAAHLREHARSVRVAVVGAAPVRLDDSSPSFARFAGQRFNSVLTEIAARSGRLSFAEAYTGNFSIRRAVFREAGGFEEAFDGYGLEDYELALRLTVAGVDLVLSSEALASQYYDKSFADAARDNESRGRSAVIFGIVHPSRAAEVAALRDPSAPSVARQIFRFVLPRMTRILPILPRLLIWSVAIAERCRARRLAFIYEIGLEYFYLLGVRQTARDRGLTAMESR